jgi:hypothetical protein
MNFWKQVFSDNGAPSASRILTLLHSGCVIGLLANFSYHNHGAIPDLATLGGLAAFATTHYAVNRFSQRNGSKGSAPAANGK